MRHHSLTPDEVLRKGVGVTQTSLEVEDDEPDASGGTGLLDLSRQQRNLLLLRPLFQLELNKQRIGDESTSDKGLLQGIDTHYLALSALDRMMEGTTISTGCTREEMLSHLADVAQLMKPKLTKVQQQKVADVVLGALDNKVNGYKEFVYEHFDAARRATRTVKFKLVVHEPDIEDIYRYKPTPEGYLVYLGMLDLSPEDYQELMEKMLDLLVQRGRFDAALEIARRARTLSIEYRQLIRDRLHQAYRAPGSVDWRRDMAGGLDRARDHVRQRQSEDQRMVESVQEALRMAEEQKARANLSQLLKTLQSASTMRSQLVVDISGASERFLQAQRSLFRARRATGLPDLESVLFPRLVGLPGGLLSDQADAVISALYPTAWPRVLDLNTMFALLLEPRPDDVVPDEDDGELTPIAKPEDQFSPEIIKAVSHWLKNKFSGDTDVRLADVLVQAANEGMSVTARRCLVFAVYKSFSDTETEFPNMKSEALSDWFKVDIAQGTDLLFSPKGGPH
jgi:hypothetical protein